MDRPCPQVGRRSLGFRRNSCLGAIHSVVHSCGQGARHRKSPGKCQRKKAPCELASRLGGRGFASPECPPDDNLETAPRTLANGPKADSSRISKVAGSTGDRAVHVKFSLRVKRSEPLRGSLTCRRALLSCRAFRLRRPVVVKRTYQPSKVRRNASTGSASATRPRPAQRPQAPPCEGPQRLVVSAPKK